MADSSEMKEPKIASKQPFVGELEPGEYYWCQCGLSQNQPFCDGSHSETPFQPVKFVISEKKRVALCQCKRTKNPPMCDGSHKDL